MRAVWRIQWDPAHSVRQTMKLVIDPAQAITTTKGNIASPVDYTSTTYYSFILVIHVMTKYHHEYINQSINHS